MRVKKEEFEEIFKGLYEDKILLVSKSEIKTGQDMFLATMIYYGTAFNVGYLYWRGYGAGAYSYTRRDLHFLMEKIFKDYKYYKVMTKRDYETEIDKYIMGE